MSKMSGKCCISRRSRVEKMMSRMTRISIVVQNIMLLQVSHYEIHLSIRHYTSHSHKNDKFELLSEANKVLKVWWVLINQVVSSLNLRERENGKELCAVTTHLKARNGILLPTIRNEQEEGIVGWLKAFLEERPLSKRRYLNADEVI